MNSAYDSYKRYQQNINANCRINLKFHWHEYGFNGSGENKKEWAQITIVREHLRKLCHT